MASDTGIGWTHDTVNGWWGCQKVSPACKFCYAEQWSDRHSQRLAGEATLWGAAAPRWTRVAAAIRDLRKSARRGDKEGRPRRVFMHSMSDLFEDRTDLAEPRLALWNELKGLGTRIQPLLLTKRPDIMLAWATEHGWPEGAWAGVTAEDQSHADARLDVLLRVPAPGHFVSVEPMLESVDLTPHLAAGLGWVIVGGESGGATSRPMLPAWARALREQCSNAEVPYFFKQWGTWAPANQLARGATVRLRPAVETKRFGHEVLRRWPNDKNATGHLLDHQTVQQLPAGWLP